MFKLNTFFWFAFALIVWDACASQAKSLDDIRAESPLGWMGISNSRDQKSVKKIDIEDFKEKLGRLQAQQEDIQKELATQQDTLSYLKEGLNSLKENGMKKIEDLTASLLDRFEKQQKDSQTKMEAQDHEWEKFKIQQEVAKKMSEVAQEKQKKMEYRIKTFMNKMDDLHTYIVDRMEKHEKVSQTKIEAQVPQEREDEEVEHKIKNSDNYADDQEEREKRVKEITKEVSKDSEDKQMKDQEVEQNIELVDGFQMEDEGVELSTSTTQRQPDQDGSTRARVEERDEQEDEIEYSGDYDGHQEEREESVKEITKEVEQKINIPNEDEEEELSTSTTPISFEKIGSRLFYIEPSNELNWYEAESFCQDNGGHLAAFENFEEYQAVRAKIRYFGLYWIGINDEAEEGVFVTSTSGEPAPFLKWYRNQPDSAGDEDCVQIYGYLDGMNDNICSKKMLFICQADEKIQY